MRGRPLAPREDYSYICIEWKGKNMGIARIMYRKQIGLITQKFTPFSGESVDLHVLAVVDLCL
jgi:hypothetical protein